MKKIIEKIKELLLSVPVACLWFGILGMSLTAIFALPLAGAIEWPMVPVIALGVFVVFINVFCDMKLNPWNALSYLIGAVLIQLICWL